MCGLTGYVPKNTKSIPNMDWIKILLSYNDERGSDSSGYYMNGEVVKTLDGVKEYIIDNPLKITSKNKTIIIHNRKSSVGAISLNNAHPFEITDGNRTMVIAHNGTIFNIEALAAKRGISTKSMFVDSLILGNILFAGDYSVLDEYNGGAALLWAYKDEPNVLYAFKGASRSKHNGAMEEERPLHLLMDETGYYLSSLIEPLKVISNGEKECYTLEENTVVKIHNNRIIKIYSANRENAFQNRIFVNAQQPVGGQQQLPLYDTKAFTYKYEFYLHDNKEIYDEIADGVGPAFVGMRYYNIPDNFENVPAKELSNKYLLNGYYTKNLVPVKSKSAIYFLDGIKIKESFIDYISANEDMYKTKNAYEKYQSLSMFSSHPIMPLYNEIKEHCFIFYEGKILAGHTNKIIVEPFKESNRIYIIEDGSVDVIKYKCSNDCITADIKNEQDSVDEGQVEIQINEEYFIYRFKSHTDQTEKESIRQEHLLGVDMSAFYFTHDNDLWFTGDDLLIPAVAMILEDSEPKVWDNIAELENQVKTYLFECLNNGVHLASEIMTKYRVELSDYVANSLENLIDNYEKNLSSQASNNV